MKKVGRPTGTAGVLACRFALKSPLIAVAGEDARGPSRTAHFS
jgi:hypothetical protein